MKILHLTTSFSGGAGIAARRICQAQIEYGLNASILGGQVKTETQMFQRETLIERPRIQEIQSSLVTFVQSNLIQKGEFLTTPVSIDAISIRDARVIDADIVNIHAFYNLLSMGEIAQLAKHKSVVVTLHDQRLFTGGCHYSLECNQYKTVCGKCPQVKKYATPMIKFAHRAELVNRATFQKIAYATPSEWLMKKAKESALLRNSEIEVINNPIPAVFQSIPRSKKSDVFTIGFVSENLNNPYKGITALVEAVNIVSKSLNVVLRLYGTGEVKGLYKNVKVEYSRFDGDAEGVLAFNNCDVIVIPSIQDNSPSVLTESIMSGVPVIASKVGGITEILSKYGLPGFEPGDFRELAKLLEFQAVNKPNFPLLKSAKNDFSYSSSAKKYYSLYNKILNQ